MYIDPPELAETRGTVIQLMDTEEETRGQLSSGQEMCAVALRPFGKVALLMRTESDFRAVKTDQRGLTLYAIPAEVASRAKG